MLSEVQHQEQSMEDTLQSPQIEEMMDFENLAGLDLATLKRQLKLPIRGPIKKGSADSRSGTWP